VLPKPLQRPHPPLWVTVTSPGTEIDAAERGLGALGVAAAGFAEQERRTREYHRRIRHCEPAGAAVNDRVATLNFLYCHEDAETARARGMQFLGTFGVLNAHLLFTREAYPTPAYGLLANLAPAPRGDSGSPGEGRGVPEGVCIGDPESIVRAVKEWESIGVDDVNFLLNAAEVLPQAQVLDSLRLFASEVMPRFRPEGSR
jgi:alkanesulfonate monooxygenase SsuD/methylene tetrahydromethanopterin reductase-like flavin-dependent oxidoreductase (luciferase family)